MKLKPVSALITAGREEALENSDTGTVTEPISNKKYYQGDSQIAASISGSVQTPDANSKQVNAVAEFVPFTPPYL